VGHAGDGDFTMDATELKRGRVLLLRGPDASKPTVLETNFRAFLRLTSCGRDAGPVAHVRAGITPGRLVRCGATRWDHPCRICGKRPPMFEPQRRPARLRWPPGVDFPKELLRGLLSPQAPPHAIGRMIGGTPPGCNAALREIFAWPVSASLCRGIHLSTTLTP